MLIDFFKRFIYIALLFIYIYGPPFAILPFSADKLIHLIFIASLFFYPRQYSNLFRYPIITLTVIIQMVISVYTLVLYLLNPTEYNYILHNLLMLTEVIISSMFFIVLYLEWFKNSSKTHDLFFHTIIIITIIQAIISFAGILDPKLNQVINNDFLFYDKEYNFGISYRGYGMSDDYFFTMPIVQGIGIILCMYYIFQGKYLYLIPIPVLLLSISFNARIGFTPVVIFVLASMVFVFKKSEMKVRAILIFILVLTAFIVYFNPETFWKSKLDQGVSFGYSFFDITAKFIFSSKMDESANYSVLRDMVFLPERENLIFGTGESIFYSNQRNSDIGYINQIFYGGLVYLILQFSVLFVTFYHSYKSLATVPDNMKYKVLLVVLLVTLMISNVKGYFFLVKPGLRLIYLIFFMTYFIAINQRQGGKTAG